MIKKFEKYTTVNKSDTENNLSAEFHVNKKEGKSPYIKEDGLYVIVDDTKTIPKKAEYLKPKQVAKYNKIAIEIKDLQEKQNYILAND